MTALKTSEKPIPAFSTRFPNLEEDELEGLKLCTRKVLFIQEENEKNQKEANILQLTDLILYENGEFRIYNGINFRGVYNPDLLKKYVKKQFIMQVTRSNY